MAHDSVDSSRRSRHKSSSHRRRSRSPSHDKDNRYRSDTSRDADRRRDRSSERRDRDRERRRDRNRSDTRERDRHKDRNDVREKDKERSRKSSQADTVAQPFVEPAAAPTVNDTNPLPTQDTVTDTNVVSTVSETTSDVVCVDSSKAEFVDPGTIEKKVTEQPHLEQPQPTPKETESSQTTSKETTSKEQDEEEKQRLRRERIDQWKRSRLSKQPSLSSIDSPHHEPISTPQNVSDKPDTHGTKRKSWNLDDDDDDDGPESTQTTSISTDTGFTLPKMTYKSTNSNLPSSTISKQSMLTNPSTNSSTKPLIKFGTLVTQKPGHSRSIPKFTLPSTTAFKRGAGSITSNRVQLDDDDVMDIHHDDSVASAAKISVITSHRNDTKPTDDMETNDDDDVDPLDAFMVNVHVEVKRITDQDATALKPSILAQSSSSPSSVLNAQAKPGIVSHHEQTIDTQNVINDVVMMDVASTSVLVNTTTNNQPNNNNNQDEDDIVEPDQQDSTENRLTGTLDVEDIISLAAATLAAKKKTLPPIDHTKIIYESFQKDFYVEPPEIAEMTREQVIQRRLDLDGIKVRGARCPKPIEKWTHFGMPSGALEVIRRVLKYDKPSPIQAQAIPAIVSGRDVIGIAKTGSGKTMAFLLPMFRHIKGQRPLKNGEGPIALIMTPTRELAMQIYRECKHFTKLLKLRAVCCYGGASIKDQIADAKRGAEIFICTPGRMIDLLCANHGRVTNLKRVTYLVLDEADRMFDLGFEQQVMKIINNIRPDRQTVLFSATFPKKMEALAHRALQQPLQITVGARSVVATDVTQIVEVHMDDESRFHRLLELLGVQSSTDPDSKSLIFVDRQDAADMMMMRLMRRGYPCLSLHGGKDQSDRDSTISDFKSGTTNILVATSVAARGLDVKGLTNVINYDAPNHLEDYVHRAGRTGRAGNKGTAYTFILPEQDRFAPDIIKALKMSGVDVPTDLQSMCDGFMEKVKAGHVRYVSTSGFGGRGLEHLDKEREAVKRIQKKSHGGDVLDDGDEEDDEEKKADVTAAAAAFVAAAMEGKADTNGSQTTAETKTNLLPTDGSSGSPATSSKASDGFKKQLSQEKPVSIDDRLKQIQAKLNATARASETTVGRTPIPTSSISGAIGSAAAVAAALAASGQQRKHASDAPFSCKIEINDFSKHARWKVTSKDTIAKISDTSKAAITIRGRFVEKGHAVPVGESKLHLLVEADSQFTLDQAKAEINRVLMEATMQSIESEVSGVGGGMNSGGGGLWTGGSGRAVGWGGANPRMIGN